MKILKKVIGNAGAEYKRLQYTRRHAQEQARKKLWWDEVCRQICPSIFQEHKDHLQIDDFRVECLIVGKSQGTTEGIPADTAYDFQKKLMGTTLKGCIIQISEKLVHIPTAEAQELLAEAMYYNVGNQNNYIKDKSNVYGVRNENLALDYEDMKEQVRILHDNKENMFHAAYIITIWAETEEAMKIAKSHIKGVMRENRILGEIPLRRMLETFMTGQPYYDMADFTIIDVYSGLASIISPTINPMSPLAGTGAGVYFGNEVHTGKDVTLDFFSESAPHAIMVGATGSGKTYALVLLMIRLYLEGRKVMYLTKKRDDHTNYRGIAEYFAPLGGIIEIGRSTNKHKRHNINPLQIICTTNNLSEEEAIDVFDGHKDIVCAFLKSYYKEEYSVNQDSFVDQMLNELYEEHGIIRDNPKTWKPENFPVMRDLVKKMEDTYPNLRGHRKTTCEVLINKLYKFSPKGAYDFVNSPTDVDFSLMFEIIDIVAVPKGLKDAMNVLITGLLASQVSAADSNGLTIIIDEGGAFLREPELADMILTGLTQWRSQNTQLIFATQQFGDLESAKMSEAFMANTFFKMVFGANMDESVIPYVQKFLHLRPQHVEDLKRLKRGQCLLKVRNKYVSVEVTSSESEHAIIKGIAQNIDRREVLNTDSKDSYKIKLKYQELCNKHKVIFENMFEGDFSESALRRKGYKSYAPHRINGSGTTRSWVHSSIINGSLIEQQTPDHYNTVVQIAAYLIDKGFENVQINHYNDVDVVGTLNGKTYAFEYERDGSHPISDIFEKFSRAKLTYDNVFIVCMASNKVKVAKAVEPDGIIPYGEKPKNMCTRGTQFADLIEDIISGYKTNYPISKEDVQIIEEIDDVISKIEKDKKVETAVVSKVVLGKPQTNTKKPQFSEKNSPLITMSEKKHDYKIIKAGGEA